MTVSAATTRPARPFAITLRPIADSDQPFLAALYASSRAQELSVVPWDEQARQQFLFSQFSLQHAHYLAHYPGAQLSVIERDGEPIGRIYVHRTPGDIRLMEITVHDAVKNLGLGTALICELLAEAELTGARVSLHVEPDNRAAVLYRRMGFTVVERVGVYDFMQWLPGTAA